MQQGVFMKRFLICALVLAVGLGGADAAQAQVTAYSTVTSSNAVIISSGTAMAHLHVPKGTWFIIATMDVDNDAGNPQKVECHLVAGGSTYTHVVRLPGSGVNKADNESVALQMVKTLPSNSNEVQVKFTLSQNGANVTVRSIAITAIKIDSLNALWPKGTGK
jgi:hypothetical protein